MKTTTAIRWAVATATIASTGAASAQISLYEFDGFGGRSYSSNHSVSNLADTGFNDRASSVVVRGGRWQVCCQRRRKSDPPLPRNAEVEMTHPLLSGMDGGTLQCVVSGRPPQSVRV